MHDTHTETSKFIYKVLTLHDKEFLLKTDQSQSYKSALYFQKCFAGKNMLEAYNYLAVLEKELYNGISHHAAYK